MLESLWQQALAAFISAFLLFIPWALGRYRDRQTKETEIRFWQALARELLDLNSGYRALVNRYLVQESTPDLHIKTMFDEYELDFDRLTKEYKDGPKPPDNKKA